MKTDSLQIVDKIKELEKEILELKALLPKESTVKVPENIKSIFDKAEKIVSNYFKNLESSNSKGTIQIEDERYIMIRASSLSSNFFKNLEKNFSTKTKDEIFSIARDFLFDLGHVIGIEDCNKFSSEMNLIEPLEKLSAGPIYFAYSGWASVEILPESNPVPNENFFLKYNHPYSFEADSWIKKNEKSDVPVCIMSAAYSSGWCEASYGIPLTAVEITCRAKGDSNCTFIMSHPDKIHHFLDDQKINNLPENKIEIPYFFERKKVQDDLFKSESMLKTAQRIAQIGSWEFDIETNTLIWSDELYKIFEFEKQNIQDLRKEYYAKLLKKDIESLDLCIKNCITSGKSYELDYDIQFEKKRIKNLFCMGIPQFDERNRVVKIYGIVQDVTENKNKNSALIKTLKDKEVLLKEVHHRVKNNLQIISSLLNLQSSYIENQDVLHLYNESQNRIKSIASIHEMLYQSDDLTQIPFYDYLHKLTSDLANSFYGKELNFNIYINTKEKFNIDTSIPLGLLINEIISNSLKHGLKNQSDEFIYVEILKKDHENFILKIGDNGKGFNSMNFINQSGTLGLMLINDLSEQLNGKMNMPKTTKGTHYELIFKSN